MGTYLRLLLRRRPGQSVVEVLAGTLAIAAALRDRPTLKVRILPVLAKVLFPHALIELRGMTLAVTDSDHRAAWRGRL